MIAIISQNQQIAVSLADLMPEQFQCNLFSVLEAENSLKSKDHDKLLLSKYILFNLDGYYPEGLKLIRQLKKLNPAIPIIAFDSHESQSIAKHILKNGASAYLPINCSSEQLQEALQKLATEPIFIN